MYIDLSTNERISKYVFRDIFYYDAIILGFMAYLSFRKIFIIDCMYFIKNIWISKINCCIPIIQNLS